MKLTGSCPVLTENSFREEITLHYADFFEKYGVPKNRKAEGDAIRKEYFRKHANGDLLFTGVKEAISELFRHMDLGIVSGDVQGFVSERLEHLGILQFFDTVHDGVSEKMDIFKKILHAYELAPYTVFYVDDGPEGIEAANALGIFSIAFVHNKSYCHEKRILAAKPDYNTIISGAHPRPQKSHPALMRGFHLTNNEKPCVKMVFATHHSSNLSREKYWDIFEIRDRGSYFFACFGQYGS